MLEQFFQGLTEVLKPHTLGIMLIGMVIGYAVGILPGLGGAVTLALMLPFTFTMTSIEAFAFLLGMLSVTATTGDITSVLFGVPGEATTAATVVDGHPMAKRGEAGRALGAVLMSSMVGALIGAFALALVVPIIRPVVLAFGSPEFFMLTLLGIAFVASLSGGEVLKGLIAGGIGLVLSLIGLDQQTGIQRATFGQLDLWDGIGLVPVTIGMFGMPEVIDLAVRGTSIAGERAQKLGGVMQGVIETFRYWWLTIRSSLLGAVIGVVPGLGGAVAQWVSYAHSVQSSHGSPRVAASERGASRASSARVLPTIPKRAAISFLRSRLAYRAAFRWRSCSARSSSKAFSQARTCLTRIWSSPFRWCGRSSSPTSSASRSRCCSSISW